MKVLTSKVKEYDAKFRRLKFHLDDTVKVKLSKKHSDYESKNPDCEFWSPLFRTMWIGKLDSKAFWYDQFGELKTDKFEELVGQTVEMECELEDFAGTDKGWFVRILSIRGNWGS
jgi:hypothetical protein